MDSMATPARSIGPIETQPLVEQARAALLEAIGADRFPGGRLPPEAQLAELLGISRGTLRAALQSLSADGLVSRRRRHGTHVNLHVLHSSMQLNRLVPFARLIEQSGYRASTDAQVSRRARANEHQAAQLGLEAREPVLIVRRLLRADRTPVITVTDVIAESRLTVAADAIVAAETTFDFLEANAGTVVDYATSEVVPRVATAVRPEGLDLRRGTPFIELHEVHFDRDHERIAMSVVCVVDRLVRLSMLRRGR
jgi:GntR family transcriptional regulator